MIKKLFIYITLMISLAACSDDIFNAPIEQLPEDGKLSVSFMVPEMAKIQTRDGFSDSAFGDVLMLVFDGTEPSTANLVQKETLTTPGTRNVTITIDENYRSNPNLFFIFLANSKYEDTAFTANGTVKMSDVIANFKEELLTSDGSKMVMSGAATLNSLLKFEVVKLFRNAAKVSVTTVDGEGENKKSTYDNPKYTFKVFGPKEDGQSSSFAGAYHVSKQRSFLGTPIDEVHPGSSFADNPNQGEIFINSTRNKDKYNNDSFIIVKGKYSDGKYYYYRLNFQNTDDGVLDILPNHFYEVQIKGDPLSAGAKTPEEAMENPVPLEQGWYQIHDHSPKIFNMITDGVRELGVDYECRNTQSAAGTTATFYVKLFSSVEGEGKAQAEYDEFKVNYKNYISFSADWLEASAISEVILTEGTDEYKEYFGSTGKYNGMDGEGHTITESPDQGKLYRITVKFNDNGGVTGVLEETATITWKGLSRDMTVVWERVFDPNELYKSVKLTWTGSGETPEMDYFPFLVGTFNDAGVRETYPKIWGASADDNNGESRDQGLHFPMPYGDAATGNAHFQYVVTLKSLGVPGKQYTWKTKLTGDDAITNTTSGVEVTSTSSSTLMGSENGDGPVLTLTYKDPSSFKYGVGKLMIIVNEGKDDEQEIPITLYHTGFFHKDQTDYLASKYQPTTSTNRPWTYYEVVSMGEQHWLDRNIGAHSAEMYIESSNDVPYMGNQAAAGGYYRVADYKKGQAPAMRDNICPPGYDIPTNAEYNAMRASVNFSTASVGSYNTACYSADTYSGDGKTKRKLVYFPKARYLDKDDAKDGESRAGYYWTQTPASGTEKDEVGAWLKCFMITGAATTYINGEVQCKNSDDLGTQTRKELFNGYAMPVRCVYAGTRNNDDVQRTSFFVKGATHVYLYTINSKGKKEAITSWPGTAICSYNNVGQVYNVAYESQVNIPDKLYVIFNYKDASGKIYSFSRNADSERAMETDNDKKAEYSDNIGEEYLVGWKVKDGIAPDWEANGTATTESHLNGTWICDASKTVKCGYVDEQVGASKSYRFYFQMSGTGKVFVYYRTGNQSNGSIVNLFGRDDYSGESYNDTYNYVDFTDDEHQDYTIYYCRSGSDDYTLSIQLKDFVKGSDGKYHGYVESENSSNKTAVGKGGKPVTTYTYQIKGNIFNNSWDTNESMRNLTKKSGTNIWEGEYTLDSTDNGAFGIRELNPNGTEHAFYTAESSSSIGEGGTFSTKTGGTKFSIGKGTFKFSFNADTKVLTVTKESVTETYYYRINVTGNQNDNFSYGYHDMTESNGKWVLSGLTKPKGNFKIEKWKISNGNKSRVEDIGSTKSGGTTVNKDEDHPTGANSNGFWIDQSGTNGTVTLTFDPANNKLRLTVEGGGTTDYSNVYVNVIGAFNNWQDNGVKPGSDGIAKHTNLKIGNGNFRIKVWDGSTHNYSNSGKVNTDTWVSLPESEKSMQINNAGADDSFNVEWDYVNKKIKITKYEPENGTTLDKFNPGNYYITFNGTYNLWMWIEGDSDKISEAKGETYPGSSYEGNCQFTLSGTADTGKTLKIQFNQSEKSYEASVFKWNSSTKRWEASLGSVSAPRKRTVRSTTPVRKTAAPARRR